MIAFVVSTIGCALFIAEMFEKLQTNPITVSLAERPSSIQEVNNEMSHIEINDFLHEKQQQTED